MKYRQLGKTGLQVSVVGLGTHQFSGEWAKNYTQGEVESLLDTARQSGINLIDTAECYGDHLVESLLGSSITKNRADWIIATKFGHGYRDSQKVEAWSAAEVVRQLEDSLKALRTDYVDLYQFHSGDNSVFGNEELWAVLNTQVQTGKVRFLGVSLAASLLQKQDLAQIRAAEAVNAQVVQVVYNRLQRQAEEELLPFCAAHRIGVLARVPLAKGFLSGAYQPGTRFAANDTRSTFSNEFNDEQLQKVEQIKQQEVPAGENMAQWALAWCLKNSTISAVVAGCKNHEQIRFNAAVAERVNQDVVGTEP
jgi:myo-inositol catabolism protein IolS